MDTTYCAFLLILITVPVIIQFWLFCWQWVLFSLILSIPGNFYLMSYILNIVFSSAEYFCVYFCALFLESVCYLGMGIDFGYWILVLDMLGTTRELFISEFFIPYNLGKTFLSRLHEKQNIFPIWLVSVGAIPSYV